MSVDDYPIGAIYGVSRGGGDMKEKINRLLCFLFGHKDIKYTSLDVIAYDCERCGRTISEIDPDYDPTPWCSGCGAMKAKQCHCGPRAEND